MCISTRATSYSMCYPNYGISDFSQDTDDEAPPPETGAITYVPDAVLPASLDWAEDTVMMQ